MQSDRITQSNGAANSGTPDSLVMTRPLRRLQPRSPHRLHFTLRLMRAVQAVTGHVPRDLLQQLDQERQP